jgi:hypothetical protein
MQGHCPLREPLGRAALCPHPGHLQRRCLSEFLIHPTFFSRAALIGCRIATVPMQNTVQESVHLAESTETADDQHATAEDAICGEYHSHVDRLM